jgi:hypothetical protein
MAKRKVGGGIFDSIRGAFSVPPPGNPQLAASLAAAPVASGPSWFSRNLNNILIGVFLVIFVAAVLGIVVWALLKENDRKKGEGGSTGGSVAPAYSNFPGKVEIAAINQGPSAGQAIIYFSKAEAYGTTCDTCEVEFKTTTTYTGAYPDNPDPVTNVTTVPLTAGIANISYTSQSPRGYDSLPTQVQIDVTATVINTVSGLRGQPVSKSVQLPYIA